MPWVTVQAGAGPDRVVRVDGDAFVVGRVDGCDLILDDAGVSRRHVAIRRDGDGDGDGDGWVVEDLGSRNGTVLNGQAIAGRHPLAGGDVIRVGAASLRFEVARRTAGVTAVMSRAEVSAVLAGQVSDPGTGRRLDLLLEIAAALDSLDSHEALLERCGRLVVASLQPWCVLLRVGDAEWTHRAAPAGARGDVRLDVSETIVDRVARNGEAVLAADLSTHPVLARQPSVQHLGIQSAMGAPILAGDDVLGLIYVDERRDDRAFERKDLLFLVAAARLIGSAVAGSRRMERLAAQNEALRASAPPARRIVGESPTIVELKATIEQRIGPVRANVLLLGETGTGKGHFAQAIHRASPRAGGPLVEVNCAAIPRDLLESELFGHEKGAFTGAERAKAGLFEAAGGGTLFLDEVGELDGASQAKLLAAIQDRKVHRVGGVRPIDVDVRIVAATNRDLEAEVQGGRFRSDLFYRLNVVTLRVPPLRERREDVPLLARWFLDQACREVGRRIPGIEDAAMERLIGHDWPGNVRELANCVERAVIFGDEGRPLGPQHLPAEVGDDGPTVPEMDVVAAKERELVLEAMARSGGNKREAARLLGWYPQKLYNRLKRYGVH